jgi:hypothetical protein
MRTQRFTNMSVVLVVLAVSVGGPATADAGSLLSGYGGPGEGSQALLGSALVNGPSGPSGGGQGGLGAEAPATAASAVSTLAVGAAHAGAAAQPASGHGSGGGRGAPRRAGTGRSAHPAARAPRASSGTAEASTLGLSGAQLLYILALLAALVLTGVLTRRMAHAHKLETPAR